MDWSVNDGGRITAAHAASLGGRLDPVRPSVNPEVHVPAHASSAPQARALGRFCCRSANLPHMDAGGALGRGTNQLIT